MVLEFTAIAEADLARIFEFNLERSWSWAERVEKRVLERAYALLITPHIGRATQDPGVYRLSITDIQYVIDYRIIRDRIRILRVQSTREAR